MKDHGVSPDIGSPTPNTLINGTPLPESRDSIYIPRIALSVDAEDSPRADDPIPSTVWRAHQAEGFTNPADLFDEPAPDASHLSRDHVTFLSEPRISVLLDGDTIQSDQIELFDHVAQLAAHVSSDYHAAFVNELEKYSQEHTMLSRELIDHLAENNLDYPEIQIGDQQLVQQLLGDNTLRERTLDPSGFAVNFQLPKPLAYFWWKSSTRNEAPNIEPTAPRAIPWGDFYRSLADDVWTSLEQAERGYKVQLERLNDYGDHAPDSYYYVFWATAEEPQDTQ